MKGPEAFRTISEAADELGVPQHVLRFWETKFSFIRPMKRAGGRRFYRRQDIEVLQGLRVLLHDQGYTIKGVQRLHKEHGVRCVLEALDHPPPFAPGSGSERVGDGAAAPGSETRPPARRSRTRKPAEAGEGSPAAASALRRPSRPKGAPRPAIAKDAAVHESLFEPDTRGGPHSRLGAAAREASLGAHQGADAQADSEAAAASEAQAPPESAPPRRTVLGPLAQKRLGEVLRDIEATKARLDDLLRY